MERLTPRDHFEIRAPCKQIVLFLKDDELISPEVRLSIHHVELTLHTVEL